MSSSSRTPSSHVLSNITRLLRKSREAQQPRRLAVEQLDSRRVLAVAIGDFDGDGYGDLATGISGEDIGAIADAGAVSVVYGTSGGLHSLGDQIWHQDVANVEGGAESGDRFGESLAVGDFNNDGFDDLAIGTPGEDIGELQEAGAVNVLYGSASGLTASGDQLFHQDVAGILDVAESFDRFGSVLAAGDYNGDGYDDLAIGVPEENTIDQQDAGLTHVLYGSIARLKAAGSKTFAQETGGLGGDSGRYDLFGAALASGDFNGDGRDDLAIGAPGENTSSLHDVGAVTILYGTATGLATANSVQYTQDSSGVLDTSEGWDSFGAALASGDFDGDGYDDLAIGAPNEDLGASLMDAGAVHVMYGRSSFQFDSARNQLWTQDSTGILGTAELKDYFGASLAAGDVNGDGRDDLVIGAPGENTAAIDAGAINLLYGTATGLSSTNNRLYSQDEAGVEGAAETYDYFGGAVAVGDTNNDGRDDVAVGIGGEAIGSVHDAGAVQVFRGQKVSSLRTDNDYIWHQDVTFLEDAADKDDFFGGRRPQSLFGGVPALNSNPGATKHLFLDFDGGFSSGIYTQPFDLDGESGVNWTERSVIQDVWSYVMEDFAPFNINVTTVLPTVGEVFRVLIGDDGTERQADPTSGWGPGDYTDASSTNNDVYVYSKRIQGWYGVNDNLAARFGTTASHEAGHGFGLGHKGTYHAFGALLDEYSDGGADWTPIMGGNLATDRTIWTQSVVALSVDTNAEGDDDYNVLKNELGLRADDHAATLASATYLGSVGLNQSLLDTGLITSTTDKDIFRFVVSATGMYSIAAEVADVGPNLDATLRLYRGDGSIVTTVGPSDNLNASIFRSLPAGTYYARVGSQGTFTGDVGHYALRVVQVPTVTLPVKFYEFDLSDSGPDRFTIALRGDSPASPEGEKVADQPASQQAGDTVLAQWALASAGPHVQPQAGFIPNDGDDVDPDAYDAVFGMFAGKVDSAWRMV